MHDEARPAGPLDPAASGTRAQEAIQLWRSLDRGFTLHQAAWLVLMLTILFPYIQLLPLSTDVQPNFMLAFAILGPFLLTLRTDELVLLMGMVVVLVLYTAFTPVADAFRAWPSYLTPILILVVARNLSTKPNLGLWLDMIIRRSFYVWIGFGTAQFLTDSTIVQLTYRASTSHDRGWMSFSGEPGAFATLLFLFAAYFITRRMYRLAILSFIVVVVVAQSALGIIYFVILGLAWALVSMRRNLLLGIIFGLGLTLLGYLIGDLQNFFELLPEGRRFTRVLEMLLLGDDERTDGSVAARTDDLVLAYSALTDGPPYGNGLNGVRLKSGWGAYVFELGWLGLLLALGWISFFLHSAAQLNRNVLSMTIAIIVILFSSTPLSTPTASFIFFAIFLAARDSAARAPADQARPQT